MGREIRYIDISGGYQIFKKSKHDLRILDAEG